MFGELSSGLLFLLFSTTVSEDLSVVLVVSEGALFLFVSDGPGVEVSTLSFLKKEFEELLLVEDVPEKD